MKKSLKHLVAVTASVISTGAFASNLENPLYLPKANEAYVKAGAAYMYKRLDHTESLKVKGLDGKEVSPVWRFAGDLGYGITDRLDVHGRFGYTKDTKTDRKGMHRGRIGMTLRALTEDDPIILDFYADGFLSIVNKMKGTYRRYGTQAAFDFENYSNGRVGLITGTRFGKTWNDFTLAGHVEYLQTIGNHNNQIKIDPTIPIPGYSYTMGDVLPSEISVDLKGTNEICAGFDAFYQMDSKWSFGAGFEYYQHSDNGVKGIHTQLPDVGPLAALQQGVVNTLLANTRDMKDGWDEYIIKASVSNQVTDSVQVSLYGEYTIDDSHELSQNGTDVKAEIGVRLNAQF